MRYIICIVKAYAIVADRIKAYNDYFSLQWI
jgi:hypothetical protein